MDISSGDAAILGAMVNSGCDALDAGDNATAIQLLSTPAESGVDIAMFNLAIAYKRRGDLGEAIKWYTKAANAGDVDAMAYLGYMYKLQGDLPKATDWYTRAANVGHAAARTVLATLAFEDSGGAAAVTRASGKRMGNAHAAAGRMDMATTLWMSAADAGDGESMLRLGVATEERHDLGEAILWLTAASRAGVTEASDRLDLIVPKRPSPSGSRRAPRWFRRRRNEPTG